MVWVAALTPGEGILVTTCRRIGSRVITLGSQCPRLGLHDPPYHSTRLTYPRGTHAPELRVSALAVDVPRALLSTFWSIQGGGWDIPVIVKPWVEHS